MFYFSGGLTGADTKDVHQRDLVRGGIYAWSVTATVATPGLGLIDGLHFSIWIIRSGMNPLNVEERVTLHDGQTLSGTFTVPSLTDQMRRPLAMVGHEFRFSRNVGSGAASYRFEAQKTN